MDTEFSKRADCRYADWMFRTCPSPSVAFEEPKIRSAFGALPAIDNLVLNTPSTSQRAWVASMCELRSAVKPRSPRSWKPSNCLAFMRRVLDPVGILKLQFQTAIAPGP